MKGQATVNTYGGAGVNVNKNGVSVNANVGREYGAKGDLNINGKEVAKVDASAGAEAKAKVGFDKNKGFEAEAGVDAKAKAEVKVGNTDVNIGINSDLKVEIDRKGIHVEGGLHPNFDIKNEKTGKEIHLLNSPGQPIAYDKYKNIYICKHGIIRKRPGNKILGQKFSRSNKRNNLKLNNL